MQLSRYNKIVEVNNTDTVIFNTLSKEMMIVDGESAELVKGFEVGGIPRGHDDNVNELLLGMAKKGMLVKTGTDEVEKVKRLVESQRSRENVQLAVIKPTFACNFRCGYCAQDHRTTSLGEVDYKKIFKVLSGRMKEGIHANVAWYGGEPTMHMAQFISFTKSMISHSESVDARYSTNIITNGYALDDRFFNEIENLNIMNIQITLDGAKDFHDASRPHVNGSKTFDIIFNNIMKIIDKGIGVTLRVNVSHENYGNIVELLNTVPAEKRNKVRLSLCNVFQLNGEINLFDLYKKSIDLGYRYANKKNHFLVCEGDTENLLSFMPDGTLVNCSQIHEEELKIGHIEDDGTIKITNEEINNSFKSYSVFGIERCRECIELPMCVGGCRKKRAFKYDEECVTDNQGMTIEDKIKLVYLDHKKFEGDNEIEVVDVHVDIESDDNMQGIGYEIIGG